MPRYRKKPVEIEARRVPTWEDPGDVPGDPRKHYEDELIDVANWCNSTAVGEKIVIETLEGTMIASPGDWVIKGVHGEFYPCKPDIFEETYESVRPGLAEGELDADRYISLFKEAKIRPEQVLNNDLPDSLVGVIPSPGSPVIINPAISPGDLHPIVILPSGHETDLYPDGLWPEIEEKAQSWADEEWNKELDAKVQAITDHGSGRERQEA